MTCCCQMSRLEQINGEFILVKYTCHQVRELKDQWLQKFRKAHKSALRVADPAYESYEAHINDFVARCTCKDEEGVQVVGYDIDSLITRFESHAIEGERQAQERDEKFPDREKLFDDGFSLPRALMNICQEIRNLKNDNDTSKDQEASQSSQATC